MSADPKEIELVDKSSSPPGEFTTVSLTSPPPATLRPVASSSELSPISISGGESESESDEEAIHRPPSDMRVIEIDDEDADYYMEAASPILSGHSDKPKEKRVYITFQNLSYSVEQTVGIKPSDPPIVKLIRKLKRPPKEQKFLLKNITGFLKPGQMVALMGPSGAGKSTLLDVIAGRKNTGTISGQLLFNGGPRPKNWKRISGYVEQQDILMPSLTVKEMVTYSALLKLAEHIPLQDKLARVDEVLSKLGLQGCADVTIGDRLHRGISGGQAKRVNIAIELVINPSVLFLDEPTSGLDSATAYECMQIVRHLASSGRTVVCTIHQPSTDIFKLFDGLLLLTGGELAYLGKGSYAMKYFSKLGYVFPGLANPADCFLSLLGNHRDKNLLIKGPEYTPSALAGKFNSGPIAGRNAKQIQSIIEKRGGSSKSEVHKDAPASCIAANENFATSRRFAAKILTERALKSHLRDSNFTRTRIAKNLLMGFIASTVYFQVSHTQSGMQDTLAAMFFMVVMVGMNIMAYLGTIFDERDLFVHERSSGTYRVSSYFLSNAFSEVPFAIVTGILFGTLCYWMMGLNSEIERFFFFLLVMVLMFAISTAGAQLFCALAPTYDVAAAFVPLFLSTGMMFSGFLVRKDNIPPYWLWAHYISIFKYGFEAVTVNEMAGSEYHCTDTELARYGGICPVTSGDKELEALGFDGIHKWNNALILGLIYFIARTFAYLAMRFIHHEKR